MIVVAGLILTRQQDGCTQILFVRAKNNKLYVLPGGKQELGESIDETLARELKEELDTECHTIRRLGAAVGKTPDGRELKIYMYSGRITGMPRPSSEIQELLWINKKDLITMKNLMTPMTLNHILPFLEKQKIW